MVRKKKLVNRKIQWFLVPYERKEWGEALVQAASLKEAKDGVFSVQEEYDNKSEYEWDYSQLRAAKRCKGGWE